MRFLKIQQLWLLIIMQFLFLMNGSAQYKSYKLNSEGDTINAITNSGLKQGKWVIHIDAIRGEPGYEEEGIFNKDKKEGPWRLYNLTGDPIGVENYKLGGKDGIQQYYTYLGDLVREESWRAYNPESPYDTVPIYGIGSNEIIDMKLVKAVPYSVKHGDWKYYEPGNGRMIKTEKYDRGLLIVPGAAAPPVTATVTDKAKKPDKTPQMLEWEKKNKGKKKVLRDGRTVE